MYSLLKINNAELMRVLTTNINNPLYSSNVCYQCLRNKPYLKGNKIWLHLSRPYTAQYLSALKHILSKKSKHSKKKAKKYVEVIKATDDSVTTSITSVDTLRGSQLSALTNQLSQKQGAASHTIIRNHFTDTTRHYDPLPILPIESSTEHVDNVLERLILKGDDAKYCSSLRLALPKTPPTFVPDLINQIKKLLKEGENATNITIVRNAKLPYFEVISDTQNIKNNALICDLEKINVVEKPIFDDQRKELRNKLRLRPLKINTAPEVLDSEVYSELSGNLRNQFLEDPIVDELQVGYEDISSESQPQVVEKSKKKTKASYNVNLKKFTREAIAKQRLSDLERKNKAENLNSNFLSYVDVCVNTNNANDAYCAIKAFKKKAEVTKNWQSKLMDVDIYNTVIEAFAKDGNLNKVNELLDFVKQDGLCANLRTYAAILDCLGRQKNKSISLINSYLEEMTEQGLQMNSIFTDIALTKCSFEHILKSVNAVIPDFEPQPCAVNLAYDCPLLNSFNDENSSYPSPAPRELTREKIEALFGQQLDMETKNYVKIKTVEKRQECTDGSVQTFRNNLAKSELEWKATIESGLERDFNVLKLQGRHKSHFFFTLYPYLVALPRRELVDIILQEIRKLAEGSETYSPTTKHLYRTIGAQVCLRYQIRKKTENGSLDLLKSLFTKYINWYINPNNSSATNTRQHWQQLLSENFAAANLTKGEPMWRSHVLTGVGRFLYNIIIRDVKIDVNIMKSSNSKPHFLPAFYTLFRNKGHICKEEVKPHPILSKLYRSSLPENLVFEASMIPMSCPPLPWSAITSGGCLVTKTELIRLPFQATAQWKLLENTPVNKLYPAFDSLNQLAAVPWTVNEQVLDVILELFNSGGSSKLDVPEPPSSCPAADPVTPEMTSKERYQAFRQRLAVRRRRAEMYSLWCDALYKLSLANHFRSKVFWLPHNMDFRGRVYPVAPHLNHLGSDLSRSLLVFAKGEPLGADGFDWLKMHAINLTGTHKKQSMASRLEYANEILDDMLDSAEKPLTGRMWWAKSEEPWQTLATCMEIRKAINSGDPSTYISNFPVHQDGSCNGLQHYAALGRDRAGGESVNLTPAPVPQDVYSCVVAIVERERAKDAENGVKIAQALEGFVYRKVIKQTVMTTVYGVTRFGARLQIARQLKDIDNFPKEHVWAASMFLVNKTFESLQEMFTSTKEIQDWFTECARLIAQVCGENVEWITPLGLPIVQPYTRPGIATSSTDHVKFIGLQASTLNDAYERPNIMKQKNAFAPNFVHSLDSSHMMLTSLQCERNGLTFVSVHDCYWTHASTVAAMNNFCRQQFVALHSQPVLQDLSNYFIQRFSYDDLTFINDGSAGDLAKKNLNRALRAVPSTGSLNLQNVLKSPYFFS